MPGDDEAASYADMSLVLLLGLLWGMTFALNKLALATIPPLTLVAARLCLASVMLWLVVWLGGRRVPLRWNVVPTLIVQGSLACLIPYTLIAFGQQSVDSALAAILNSTTPLFVCLIGLAWLPRGQLAAGKWLGVALGLGGAVLIAGVGALGGIGRSTVGQAAILIAAVSSAIGVFYGRRLGEVAPEVAAAGTLTFAALLLVPLALSLEAPLSVTPSWLSAAALVANAVAATGLGFVVYFRLLRTVGSVRTASVSYLKPAVGVLLGWTLMAEPVTWKTVLGLFAIVIGVAIINKSSRPPARSLLPQNAGPDATDGVRLAADAPLAARPAP